MVEMVGGGMTLDLINLSPKLLLHLKVTSSFVFNSGGVTLSNKNYEALMRSEMYLWAGSKVTISGMLFWMVVVFTGSSGLSLSNCAALVRACSKRFIG